MIKREMLKGKMKFAAAGLVAAGLIIVFVIGGCDKKKATTTQNETVTMATVDEKTSKLASETTKKTDIVAFTVKDADGNDVTLEGVAVTDAEGNTVITVTDASGKEIKVNAKAETVDGKTVIKDAVIVSGGEITKSDGTVVRIEENTSVSEVKDNNSGEITADVAISEDKKQEVVTEQAHEDEVAQAKDEVAKVEETNAAVNNSDTGSNNNSGNSSNDSNNGNNSSTAQPDTQAPATEAPATETPATEAPAEETPAPTEPATSAPTEAPSQTEVYIPEGANEPKAYNTYNVNGKTIYGFFVDAGALMDKINADRAAQGLAAWTIDAGLQQRAEQAVLEMSSGTKHLAWCYDASITKKYGGTNHSAQNEVGVEGLIYHWNTAYESDISKGSESKSVGCAIFVQYYFDTSEVIDYYPGVCEMPAGSGKACLALTNVVIAEK